MVLELWLQCRSELTSDPTRALALVGYHALLGSFTQRGVWGQVRNWALRRKSGPSCVHSEVTHPPRIAIRRCGRTKCSGLTQHKQGSVALFLFANVCVCALHCSGPRSTYFAWVAWIVLLAWFAFVAENAKVEVNVFLAFDLALGPYAYWFHWLYWSQHFVTQMQHMKHKLLVRVHAAPNSA